MVVVNVGCMSGVWFVGCVWVGVEGWGVVMEREREDKIYPM